MTAKIQKKKRLSFTPEQKLDYVKLMLDEGYTTQQIVDISGACSSVITRWKRQYLEEINGQTPTAKALTEEQRTIQDLRK